MLITGELICFPNCVNPLYVTGVVSWQITSLNVESLHYNNQLQHTSLSGSACLYKHLALRAKWLNRWHLGCWRWFVLLLLFTPMTCHRCNPLTNAINQNIQHATSLYMELAAPTIKLHVNDECVCMCVLVFAFTCSCWLNVFASCGMVCLAWLY